MADTRPPRPARRRRERQIPLIRFAAAAVIFSLATYWYHPDLIERFDQQARDLIFALRQTPQATPEVVVVSVDEESIKRYGRWPWSRTLQARLMRAIKQSGAAVLALDITYLKSESPQADAALIQALQRPGTPVVGGYFFRAEQTSPPGPDALAILRESRIRLVLQRPGANPGRIPAHPFVEVSQADVARHTAAAGFFNVVHDPDGLVRNAALVARFKDDFYPSLPLQALARYLNEDVALTVSTDGAQALTLGRLQVPINPFGELPINFYARDRSPPILSAAAVLDGRAAAALRGRLVFLGVTELGIADLRATPVDPSFPGVSVHATVAANVLQGWMLRRGNEAVVVDVLLVVLVPLLVVHVMARMRHPLLMAGVALLVAALTGLLHLQLVQRSGLLLSLVYPLLSTAVAAALVQVWYTLNVQRRSRFLRRAFTAYVSPALVERVVDNPNALSLGGEKREVTVFFSDIRGFTTLAESLPPEQLVRLLNRYLSRMTDIVMDHQGTLEKYIGDAIMALYNAPLVLPGHARLAADTALEMMRVLEVLNREFQDLFGLQLQIGVGLNTGEAIIGNLGSERRFHYAAVGDTVNLGARLESRTKAYGVTIIISDATRRQLGPDYVCRRLDRLQVKGKSLPVEIHQLMGPAPDLPATALAADFEAALVPYFAADFEAAVNAFEDLARRFPEDRPSRLFLERCRDFLAKPPPRDWDGVFVAKEK